MKDKLKEPLNMFFGVAIQRQTYLNILYLLLSFPLGIAYFTFLITGFTLGIGLLFVWIGFVILLALLAGWWLLLVFERLLAIWLLHIDIPPLNRAGLRTKGLWRTFVAYIHNPVTWKGLLFLVVKFPLGIFNFVISVTAFALALVFIAAPFIYRIVPLQVWFTWDRAVEINNLPAALLVCLLGMVLLVSTFHLENGLAWISAQFARLMLGNTQEPIPGPLPPDTGWPRIDPTPTPPET